MHIKDSFLIQAVTSHKPGAFKQLYDLHSEKVYNTCLSYLQNETDAKEVTQLVFIKVHKSLSTFNQKSALSTWVYRITVNTCINYLKKNNKKQFSSLTEVNELHSKFDHPGVLLENKEKSKQIFSAINQLPQNQKTAFILCFIEHLPRQEAADVMEIKLKALESLLQRAKKNLRKSLNNLH